MSVHSRADLRLVQQTLKDMARAGELRRVGTVRVPGACRPATVYAPARREVDELQVLQSSMHDLVKHGRDG
jgi:hypothetical protein